MSLGPIYDQCIRRSDWLNASKISGESVDVIRRRHTEAVTASPGLRLCSDDELPDMMRETIYARTVNGKPMSFRQFSVFSGIHQSLIANVFCGNVYRQGQLRVRIIEALHRLSLASDDDIKASLINHKKPDFAPEQKAWVESVRSRLKALNYKVDEFAIFIGRPKCTIHNVTGLTYGASPALKAAIEAGLAQLEQQRIVA